MKPCTYTIGGVRVEFPVRAYPCQIALMDKIIRGIHRAQNCLLESPTGSGKSLALLCSSLAWQRAEKQRLKDLEKKELLQQVAKEYLKELGLIKGDVDPLPSGAKEEAIPVNLPPPSQAGGFVPDCGDDDLDDFKLPKNFGSKGNVQQTQACETSEVQKQAEAASHPLETSLDLDESLPATNAGKKRKAQPPKIYYCGRTHKQISQAVRELGKTAYCDVKMSILGSRERTCILANVPHGKTKTEYCRELLDPIEGMGCMFHSYVSRLDTHEALLHEGLMTPWDIEDIVRVGNKIHACPYYATRHLSEEAEIIFCPYNYLIDPLIRNSFKLDLKGQIVILDEAHNIEDVSREAGSFSLTQEDILEAMQDCNKVAAVGVKVASHKEVAQFLSSLSNWIDQHKDGIKNYKNHDEGSQVWSGTDLVANFQHHNVDIENLPHYASIIMAERSEKDRDSINRTITSKTNAILEGLLLVLEFMQKKNGMHRDDYRIALVKKMVTSFRSEFNDSEWLSSRSRNVNSRWTYSVNFWCLNPAVVFTEIRESVRSIILTSGTLSPIASFQSELGSSFPIQLEANHVIGRDQIWVGTIGRGPQNISLNAQYKNAESYEFQDELGRSILQICQVVRHGVLCFLPSYSMLQKLKQRWDCVGLWEMLERCKVIVCEPRGSHNFEALMKQYYDINIATKENLSPARTGALLLAVCRGKVSEGVDFADDNARAVITVGIPFPNIKDVQVELKRQYNNGNVSRGLLPGSQWYEIQAYRALNQALGRCIRHKGDWGAILLVDDRFMQAPRYTNSLSKWIRNTICHYTDWNSMFGSLQQFMDKRLSIREGQRASEVVAMNTSPISQSQAEASVEVSVLAAPPASPVSSTQTPGTTLQQEKMAFAAENADSPVQVTIHKSLPAGGRRKIKIGKGGLGFQYPNQLREFPSSSPTRCCDVTVTCTSNDSPSDKNESKVPDISSPSVVMKRNVLSSAVAVDNLKQDKHQCSPGSLLVNDSELVQCSSRNCSDSPEEYTGTQYSSADLFDSEPVNSENKPANSIATDCCSPLLFDSEECTVVYDRTSASQPKKHSTRNLSLSQRDMHRTVELSPESLTPDEPVRRVKKMCFRR